MPISELAMLTAKQGKYIPFIGKDDKPPVHIKKNIMAKFLPEINKYYYNPKKYKTHMEQLGIEYPTVK